MRPYEVMVILEPALEESQVQAVINRSTELLQAGGGTVNRVDKWGKRRFAYEINKRQEGNYVLMDVRAESGPMADLDRTLRLTDDVLRHKIVRIPDHVAEGKPQRKVTVDMLGSDREDREERRERRDAR